MAQQNLNIIKIANPPIEDYQRTYLSADASAAATTIYTLDNTGFTLSGVVDYYILINNYGAQKAEIKLVDASDAATDENSFKTAALTFDHSASEPVNFIPYNQIKIYGAAVSGGTKTLIATIDIDCSQQFTQYTYDGTDYTYFYAAYYNSTTEGLSDYTDEITSASFGRNSAKRIIEAAARKAFTKIEETPDSELNWEKSLEILNDGVDEILARKRNWSFLHTRSDGSDTTTANTAYIDKPSDMGVLQFIIINGYKLEPISPRIYNLYTENGTAVDTGEPSHFTEKNNKYYLYPTPSSSKSVEFEYWKTPSEIDSLGESTYSAWSVPLIYYCASQFASIRGNDKRADKMDMKFIAALETVVIDYTGAMQMGDSETVDSLTYADSDIGLAF